MTETGGAGGMPPDAPAEHPAFSVADTPLHGGQALAGAEELIERAIDSVLEQVPVPEGPEEDPEGAAKLQPWAETAAPPSKNKRPLAELLEQFAERVRANPDALAGRPRGQHPAVAFFARFAPVAGGRGEGAGGGAGAGGGRKRRGRRGRGAGEGAALPAQPARAATVATPGEPGTGRRRRRRGGGGGAATSAGSAGAATGSRPGGQRAQRPQGQQPSSSGGPQAPGGEARRRSRGRGRRRRGGAGGGNGGGGGQQ